MKQIIALTLALVRVLSLCACGAKEDLSGTWKTTLDMSASYNAELETTDPTMAEMASYAIDLRAMTQARGSFTLEFVRYEEVPKANQDKIIKEAQNED